MSCAFDNDFSVLIVSGKPFAKQLSDAFESILTEYYDKSGLALDIEENELLRRIKYLEARKLQVDKAIWLQEEAIKHFKKPIVEYFDLFTSNNYNPKWDGNIDNFKQQLETIRAEENGYFSETEDLQKELDALLSKPERKAVNSKEHFYNMISAIESLLNLTIDFDKYTIERLAYLIKQYRSVVNRRNQQN